MPKRKRREQQHLRQQSSRRRAFQTGGTAPNEIYKPGFPMNIFGNVKLFAIVGAVIAAIMVVTAVLTTGGGDDRAADLPTPTTSPTVDPNATPTAEGSPSPTATPNPKSFTKAEQVIDAANQDYRATIRTNKGDFIIDLKEDVAPNTVNSFVFLAQKGYFNDTTFHRVVKNFVIQAGDPLGTGLGGPGYKTQDEPNQVSNKRGTISMAKAGNATDFGSQFFVNLKDNTALDFTNPGQKFYPFAEVVTGMDIVDAIAAVATGPNDKPVEAVTIKEVLIGAQPKQK